MSTPSDPTPEQVAGDVIARGKALAGRLRYTPLYDSSGECAALPDDAAEWIDQAIAAWNTRTPPPTNETSAVEAVREACAKLCERYVTPYGRAGSMPDAVEGAVHKMAVAIRALPLPSTDARPEHRPDDEALDPHLPERIKAAKRCGVQRAIWLPEWFVPWSPRNDNENAEGTWSDWVALANRILETDAAARAALKDTTHAE